MMRNLLLFTASFMSKEELVEKMEEAIAEFKSAVTPKEKEDSWKLIIANTALLQAKEMVGDQDIEKMLQVSKELEMKTGLLNQFKNKS